MTYVKNSQAIRVSIVIPVYNEAEQIAACLEALGHQTVRPYEVIVVDNNSTDATAAIAASFPFATVIQESRQGVVHARNRGFRLASGEVIGRLDADTRVPDDWVATVQAIFANSQIDAVSGVMTYRDIAWAPLFDRVDLFFRRHFARVLGKEVALQGASMAVRKAAWQSVRRDVCRTSGLHEDFDLAIHLNQAGYAVGFDERLLASIGYRQAVSTWRDFVSYAAISPRTYGHHGLKSRRHMYKVVLLVAITYPLIRLLRQGYDSECNRFSWSAAVKGKISTRVNPATFVEP